MIYQWRKISLYANSIFKYTMDTDDLTRDAYKALIIESGVISEFLRVDIGAASYRHDNEEDYLKAVHRFVTKISESSEDYLERWNLFDEVDPEELARETASLATLIRKVIETPLRPARSDSFRIK